MSSGEIAHNRLCFSCTWCIIVWRETSWCWMFVFNRYLFTTIHDENFRSHSSMYVTIHEGNFRQLYNISSSTPGSWHALWPGNQRVRAVLLAVFAGLQYSNVISTCLFTLSTLNLPLSSSSATSRNSRLLVDEDDLMCFKN